MFYIHGGGYSFGSSYELPSHEGAQMARHHDVVQVSVNHRLNILGFFDVSEIGGSAYEDSVNVGMTDLVAALQWVHENIANFGGDPDRVMIYGQSGGGSKVTTLMGMPSAAGLIHRASAQSGGGGNIPTREQQKEVARQVMKDLGLAPNDIASLQKMEWAKLIAAGNAAAAKINPPGRPMMGPGAPGTTARGLVAVRRRQGDQHAVVLRRCAGYFEERADADRLGERRGQPHVFAPDRRGVACKPREGLWRREGNRDRRGAEEDLSAEDDPDAVVYVQRRSGLNGLRMRNNVVKMAQLKHDLNAAPAYAYYFTWQIADARRLAGRVAYGGAAILLRQHQALRTGHRQHARGAGAGEEDGVSVGGFCRNRQSEHPGLDLGADRPRHQQDDGLGQRMPHGRRSRGGSAQDHLELTVAATSRQGFSEAIPLMLFYECEIDSGLIHLRARGRIVVSLDRKCLGASRRIHPSCSHGCPGAFSIRRLEGRRWQWLALLWS